MITSVFNIALTLFFVANPVGNSPAIIALIKDFDFDRQIKIMLRESIFALLIAFFFQYFGEHFLGHLNIQQYTVSLCGGSLLLLVAINMIFSPHAGSTLSVEKKEPMIVPIATPLISGPALLTVIMLFTQQRPAFEISVAILVSWIAIGGVLILMPFLQKILHRRGLGALERLMGMILAMMAVEMMVNGLTKFIEVLS